MHTTVATRGVLRRKHINKQRIRLTLLKPAQHWPVSWTPWVNKTRPTVSS